MQGNDMAALLPKCFMLYGNWLAETRSQSPNVILDKYLSKVWHITLLLAVKLSCVSCLSVVCSVTHRAFWIKLLVIVVLDLTDRHGLVHCEHCIVAPLASNKQHLSYDDWIWRSRGLLCAVLCKTIVHSGMHTSTQMWAVFESMCS